jgi:hypothetical protein
VASLLVCGVVNKISIDKLLLQLLLLLLLLLLLVEKQSSSSAAAGSVMFSRASANPTMWRPSISRQGGDKKFSKKIQDFLKVKKCSNFKNWSALVFSLLAIFHAACVVVPVFHALTISWLEALDSSL